MKIKILAASDRNNYGDLLFPLVIKKFMDEQSITCNLENYGIIRSDLSYFGALPTRSYDDLLSDLKDDNKDTRIIIAGGEVLGGEWLNILRFISAFWNKMNKNKAASLILRKLQLLKNYFYFFKKSSHPFVLDHPFYKNTRVIYNSVGALAVKTLLESGSKYKKYFEQVDLLSVRDQKSRQNFESFDIKAKLVPDSALLMSDLFTYELEHLVSPAVKSLERADYIFVQLGQKKGPDDLIRFKDDLLAFSNKNKLKIVLCPIGLALDHSDQIILKELAGMSDQFTYVDPQNIFDIMQLIRSCRMYIGTSLHGIITAQSFAVPSIAFTQKIKKLDYYIETWLSSPANIIADFTDFQKVEDRLTNFDVNLERRNLADQKKAIHDNLLSFFNAE